MNHLLELQIARAIRQYSNCSTVILPKVTSDGSDCFMQS